MRRCTMCDTELINKNGRTKFCEPCRVKRNKQLDKESGERKRARRVASIGIRYCEKCLTERISDDRRQIHCVKCKRENDTAAAKRHKRRYTILEKRRRRSRLDGNFKELNPTGQHLIPVNFDTISEIPSKYYMRSFSGGWITVLKRHGKFHEFKEYVTDAYLEWSVATGSHTVSKFFSSIGVSDTMMRQVIFGNELRALAGAR